MKISLIYILPLVFAACNKQSDGITPQQTIVKDTVITIPFPAKFITTDYIELDKIDRVSKFRSGIGHDYRDDAESCRSMKHYFSYRFKATVECRRRCLRRAITRRAHRIADNVGYCDRIFSTK